MVNELDGSELDARVLAILCGVVVRGKLKKHTANSHEAHKLAAKAA